MKQFAKLTSIVAAGVLCATVASAAPHFEIINYDAGDMKIEFGKTYVGIVYEQFDDNGKSTKLVVEGEEAESKYDLKGYAEVEFKTMGFERAWPNRVYASMYADGVEVINKIFYTGEKEQLQYRWANYVWELAQPHKIFQKKQAFIDNAWYTDATYPTQFAGDVARVEAEYDNYYGFGFWHKVDSGFVQMPACLRPFASLCDETLVLVKGDETVAKLGALAPNANVDLTNYKDYEIKIKKNFSLEVAGPLFEADGSVLAGNEYAYVRSAADMADAIAKNPAAPKLEDFNVADLVKPIYGYNGEATYYDAKDLTWSDPIVEPKTHKYYQWLVIDGVTMNGVNNLPYIFRYTGAVSTDVVEYFELESVKCSLADFIVALAK